MKRFSRSHATRIGTTIFGTKMDNISSYCDVCSDVFHADRTISELLNNNRKLDIKRRKEWLTEMSNLLTVRLK